MMTMAELLEQDTVWVSRVDGELQVMRLDDMDTRHLARLRTWLLRRAAPIQAGVLAMLYGMTSNVIGEQALWELDRDIDRMGAMDPHAWMEEQELFEGITRRLAERIEETHGG